MGDQQAEEDEEDAEAEEEEREYVDDDEEDIFDSSEMCVTATVKPFSDREVEYLRHKNAKKIGWRKKGNVDAAAEENILSPALPPPKTEVNAPASEQRPLT